MCIRDSHHTYRSSKQDIHHNRNKSRYNKKKSRYDRKHAKYEKNKSKYDTRGDQRKTIQKAKREHQPKAQPQQTRRNNIDRLKQKNKIQRVKKLS